MGACCSREKVEPVVVAAREDFHGPVEGRRCTDILGIILLLAFTIVLFGLVGYCLFHGDINRLIFGYDNCGNVCGRVNPPEKDPQFPCKGGDLTDKKFLLIKEADKIIFSPKNVHKECVQDCNAYPDFEPLFHRCVPVKTGDSVNTFVSKTGLKDFFHEVTEDLHHTSREIIGLSIIAFMISVLMVIFMKFFAGFMVWVILIGSMGLSVIGTVYCWILWKQRKNEEDSSDIHKRKTVTYLAIAIVATIVTVIILLVIIVLRKRIKLVVELFKEAGRAVTRMPFFIIGTILTVIVLAIVMILWFYFALWIQSSGDLALAESTYYYKKDTIMKITRWYNIFGMLWITQFCIGCQHMIIAGAVATWFFTRDKDALTSPIQKSAYNLVRYHLGSVAIGSLFIAIFQFLRAILKAIESQAKDSKNGIVKCILKACQCCLHCFENILMYLTRNAYIEIAIYGQSFCSSGQQAFKVLVNNALRVAAINTVGDFVLLMAKVLVVILTVFIGTLIIDGKEGVHHVWVPISVAGLFAYFVAHSFFTVYEMVIDTIFICFCEDCEMNDGINKPYFMSRNLMEFVNNTKKVLKVGDSPALTPLKDR
uniref:Choline transporter-like protein n=1 Tax=Rhodnius prolixus TaxID=13249 RepID=A0A4P6D6X4_RHOPR